MNRGKSVFFIPIQYESYSLLVKLLKKSNLWEPVRKDWISPDYLLNYARRIAVNDTLFQSFTLKDPSSLNIYMFEDKVSMKNKPDLKEVRFSCFATGVGFIEFHVKYTDSTPEEITNFAYLFKKATKITQKEPVDGKLSLYSVASSLVPQGIAGTLFFTTAAPFKYECLCYHAIHVNEPHGNTSLEKDRIDFLKRSYNTTAFLHSSESNTDMVYTPYPYDQWGGSTEGLVNITYETEVEATNYYLNRLKPRHLSKDYYFLYLLLLNQRFSAIQYITAIAESTNKNRKEFEQLNKRIVELKTIYSFNIISDDQIFQNVYAKMYRILGIEKLLLDIVDNEAQMEMLENASSAEADRLSSRFLFGISILSLFSALIDASSYFDRFSELRPVSTFLGLICTSIVVIICTIWLIKTKNQ